MTDDMYLNNRHLQQLAVRCERGAAELRREADNAAEELKTRAGGDRVTPEDWAAQKRTAADAAEQYAQQLRKEAVELGTDGLVFWSRIEEAEKVATAAECGGILIDGAQLDAAALESPWTSDAGKQAIRDHHEAKRAAIDGAGVFERVAEDGQVPFWRLTASTAAAGPRHDTAAGDTTDTSAAEPQVYEPYTAASDTGDDDSY